MKETDLLKSIKKIFTPRDAYIFSQSDLNYQRLMAEKYYDLYHDEYHSDRRKTKNFKHAQLIYSYIMQQYEELPS
jgi:hypothetical protein